MADRETIDVQRRRKGDSPEGKPRAQAPSRRKPDSGSGGGSRPSANRPPTGGGKNYPYGWSSLWFYYL